MVSHRNSRNFWVH